MRRGKNGREKKVIFCVFRQKIFDNRQGGECPKVKFYKDY